MRSEGGARIHSANNAKKRVLGLEVEDAPTVAAEAMIVEATNVAIIKHRMIHNVREAFNDLINVILTKGTLYVKARDLAIYCDINDHGRATRLGQLLRMLWIVGLAKRHNRRRPVRYTLKPADLWWRFVDVCGSTAPERRYRCATDGSVCGLIGICPYVRVSRAVKAGQGGVKQ